MGTILAELRWMKLPNLDKYLSSGGELISVALLDYAILEFKEWARMRFSCERIDILVLQDGKLALIGWQGGRPRIVRGQNGWKIPLGSVSTYWMRRATFEPPEKMIIQWEYWADLAEARKKERLEKMDPGLKHPGIK